MTKKDFIWLADMIRYSPHPFDKEHIEHVAVWLERANPGFKKELWLAYIRGECGPNGGKKYND